MSYLATQDQSTWRGKLKAAYAHPVYADANRARERLCRELRLLNEAAAASFAQGFEETLTLHCLSVFTQLGVSFKTTSLIRSVTVCPEAKTRPVTRWRTSDQRRRWRTPGL